MRNPTYFIFIILIVVFIFLSLPFILNILNFSIPVAHAAKFSPPIIKVSSCGTLDKPNAVYLLTNDIITNDTCFIVKNKKITLDLNKHSIINNPDIFIPFQYGVFASKTDNFIVKNGYIKNFGRGIYVEDSRYSTVSNVEISSSGDFGDHSSIFGIYLLNSPNAKIVNNSVKDSKHLTEHGGNLYAIYALNSPNSYIVGNSAINNTSSPIGGLGRGISVLSSNNSIIDNNKAISNTHSGIFLSDSSGVFVGNNVMNENDIGLELIASKNIIKNNVFNGNRIGVLFSYSSDNELADSFILNSKEYGIYIFTFSENNKIINSIIEKSGQNGIVISSPRSVFKNVSVKNTGYYDLNADTQAGNNNINQTSVVDSYFSSYSISEPGGTFLFKNSAFGEISFLEPISGFGTFNDDIIIKKNNASINSEFNQGVNKSAQITLTRLSIINKPTILRNGKRCDECALISYTQNKAIFKVSGEGSYSVA